MKWIKLFEDFKVNNFTLEDVIKCIKGNGVIYATIVKDLPDNDPKEPLRAVSVDDDGLITVEFDGNEYQVDLNDVEKIEY